MDHFMVLEILKGENFEETRINLRRNILKKFWINPSRDVPKKKAKNIKMTPFFCPLVLST